MKRGKQMKLDCFITGQVPMIDNDDSSDEVLDYQSSSYDESDG